MAKKSGRPKRRRRIQEGETRCPGAQEERGEEGRGSRAKKSKRRSEETGGQARSGTRSGACAGPAMAFFGSLFGGKPNDTH